MFLSTENPPRDPLPPSPSSSNLLRLTTTSSDELGHSHLSNFSIRDYAYSNRKSNIKKSWPFSTKSLNLLSTHGVTDPLPPFQTTTASSSSGKQIVLSHVHHHQTIAETSKGVCSQSRTIKNGVFTSTSKSKVEIVVAAATSNNKSNKKCGRGGGGMVKSKEDSCVGPLVATASESKTCPICKAFSSASNTTLNAHIDQCLSVDSAVPPASSKPNNPRVTSVVSAVQPVSSKPSKPRVNQFMSVDSVVQPVSTKRSKTRGKPRLKVKTLVDIYATAKECTLEDLDKRNGTKWASVLSCSNRVAADKSDGSKKRKASSVGVGPVYIDAKGQKLRILTEFSEKKKKTSTNTPLREQQEDGSSGKKSVSQSSKENSKSSRKRRRGKKLTNHKANASEKVLLENQREGSSSKGPRTIYNQRMLAKCGVVSKKLNEKGHKFHALRDQPSDDDDDDDDDDDSWSGEDRLVLSGGTDSTPLNKQKLRSQVSGRSKTMLESKRAHLDRLQSKKSLASVQEDKYPPVKNVREVEHASPHHLSPPFVSNGWRRLSQHVELKRAQFDLSDEEDEEETGKWESEMTQERELSDDDDYVSGDDNGVTIRRSSPSFSAYYDYEDDDDDEDEETSEEEEEEEHNTNVLDKTDTPPSDETIHNERAMYYSEDMIYGQAACDEEDVRFGSEVRGKGSLFVEVDNIPIPGPPGSFLPSPRGMGFDGNSSVVTSQFQSSMDHQLDRNSSESPVSAVSNFAAGRLNFPAELPSSLDIPSSYSTAPVSFCVPSHHGTIPEAEPMSFDKETPSGSRNNGLEPCCCQRKDRISLNHEASHLLQRRAASSSAAMNLTKSSSTCLDPNHPFEQSQYMIQQEFDLHSKFSRSAAVVPPSPSNSVLRLMGKDLMVMNQQGEADNINEVASSRASSKPTPQFHDPYFNTGFCLRNGFESSSHEQPQTPVSSQQQTQAPPFRNTIFDNVRYFPPS